MIDPTRPEWTAYVERAAATLSTDGLPSLEAELGRGNWKLEAGSRRRDGMVTCQLYWVIGTLGKAGARQYIRVGSFLSANAPRDRCRQHDKRGSLTVGYDARGRRLVRVRVDQNARDCRIVAVEMEQYRGVMLPRPVPVVEPVDLAQVRMTQEAQ